MNDNDDGRVVMPARKVTAVDPFAFRLSASVCSGADSFCSGNWEGRMSVVLSVARYVSPALGRAVLNDDA